VSFEKQDISTLNMNPLMIAIYFGQIDVVRLFMEEFSIGVIQKSLYDSNIKRDLSFSLSNFLSIAITFTISIVARYRKK